MNPVLCSQGPPTLGASWMGLGGPNLLTPKRRNLERDRGALFSWGMGSRHRVSSKNMEVCELPSL